jgi:nucleoid-associated protein YgaU
MGQLERYGLYVLCLVIFLILGVAIWGGDPASAGGSPGTQILNRDNEGKAPEAKPDWLAPAKDETPFNLKDIGVREVGAKVEEKPEAKDEEPAEPETRIYKVKSGDSLWTIASKELGSGAKKDEILKHNPGISERTVLALGMELRLPSVPVKATPPAPKTELRTHVVRRDDTLSSISKQHFGDEKHVAAIRELNKITDDYKLVPGSKLLLPAK